MKFLFIEDYSNFHFTLSEELRRRGHQTTLISSGSRAMDTRRDISLVRRPGALGGAAYLARLLALLPKMRGYDVVQIINPNFLSLRPEKIARIFNYLKRHNGSVILSLAGYDPVIIRALMDPSLFQYSEFQINGHPAPLQTENPEFLRDWLSNTMEEHTRYIYSEVDGAVSALYEYDLAARPILGDRLAYIGIPINIPAHPFQPMEFGKRGKINFFVGIKEEYMKVKGTDILLESAREVERRYPDLCRVTEARNVPYRQYLKMLKEANVVMDQIYSPTPATNALESMAYGRVAVSGAEEEFYNFIGETPSLIEFPGGYDPDTDYPLYGPVINARPEPEMMVSIFERLLDPELLSRLGYEGRRFVERNNAATVVADRYLDHLHKILQRG